MYQHPGPAGFFPIGVLGGLTGLLFLIGFVLMIIWLVRALAGPPTMRWITPPSQPQAESPLDIVGRRFASGEITADEYQRARDVLREPPKP